ncbi:hypothetical protein [Streptomyces sp. NPDC000880]
MTFLVPILAELKLGGVWTDITQWVYTRQDIHIEGGRDDEGQRADHGRCTLLLNNRGGQFTPRNRSGPYYGQIGRNTRFRLSVLAGDSYLATTGTTASGTGATTPDAAALDIVGDIDIRLEATLTNWLDSGSVELCGKGAAAGNQRSWLLLMRDRRLHFEWSAAGVTTIAKASTADLPVTPSGRMAVRVTLDVNNGASGNTVRFYVADSISGTWTQLGSDVVTAGVTSIFNSSAAVRVGDGWSDLGFPSSKGKVHKFELRNGIGGSVVASPDFTVQDPGDTSFVDGSGRTWTVGTNTTISNRKTRFIGEVSEWPVRADLSGADVWVSIEASGALRRTGQGNAPLSSAIRRYLERDAYEYWPMTDGENATQGAEINGSAPMLISWDLGAGAPTQPNWGKGEIAPWCEPVVELLDEAAGGFSAAVADRTGITSWSVDYARSGIGGGSETLDIYGYGTGSVADPMVNWTLYLDPFADEITIYRFLRTEETSDSAVTTLTSAGIFNTAPHHIRFTTTSGGGGANTNWFLFLDGVQRASGTHAGTAYKAVKRIQWQYSLRSGGGQDFLPYSIGHFCYRPGTADAAETYAALLGHQGETAAERIERLCGEASVPFRPTGTPAATTQLGPQGMKSLMEVLQSAADADMGALCEDRESDDVGFRFMARMQMYNQPVKLALDYSAGEVADPEPTDDDQATRNDCSVSREGGSTSPRVVITEGPLSVLSPDEGGVGIYDDSVTRNLFSDDQALQHAAWRAHLGTWDEPRYPVVSINLAANPELAEEVTAIDGGDRITIVNPPPHLPDETIDLLVHGAVEVIGAEVWEVDFNATPAGPWTVGVVGVVRPDTHGCITNGPTSDTSGILNVTSASEPRWVDSTNYASSFPFDVLVGGVEVMRVNSCTGTALSQTFGVTRGINGVQVAHLDDSPVVLATPWRPAL